MDVTKNSKVELKTLYKVDPFGKTSYWDGFNHYEIDLKKIYSYVGELTGQGEKMKITNLVKTKNYFSFKAKSKDWGEMSFLIPRNTKSKYKLLVKYKSEKDIQVAFFDSSSFNMPF
jgi:hypothetical protein